MATDVPRRPTDLRFVGPATATVFDVAPFDAVDVADRRVSYRDLLDAGVAPDVADRLRREYSLVWSFLWEVGGEDLPRRAHLVGGLAPEERAWIAESASGEGDRESTPETDPAPISPESGACPRCDGRLETFVLGDSGTEHCADCGYVGVEPG